MENTSVKTPTLNYYIFFGLNREMTAVDGYCFFLHINRVMECNSSS